MRITPKHPGCLSSSSFAFFKEAMAIMPYNPILSLLSSSISHTICTHHFHISNTNLVDPPCQVCCKPSLQTSATCFRSRMKEPPLSGLLEQRKCHHNATPLKLSHNVSRSEVLMCLEWILFSTSPRVLAHAT